MAVYGTNINRGRCLAYADAVSPDGIRTIVEIESCVDWKIERQRSKANANKANII